MSLNWNDFSAFNGTLGRDFLYGKGILLQDQIDACFDWLRALRNDPIGHGIPHDRLGDVQQVFLAMSGSTTPIPTHEVPLIRPVFDLTEADGNRHVVPTSVCIGPTGNQIQLIDSPSALGYIFSIVEPPPGISITWSSYFLPLLVLYSRCLYLVFAKSKDNVSNVAGVPIMASVMYLADGIARSGSNRPYFFGASLASGIQDQHFKIRRGMASTWRREKLLEEALFAAGQNTPTWLHLDSDPGSMDRLSKRLDQLIVGNSSINDDTSPKYRLIENLATVSNRTLDAILSRMKLRKNSGVPVTALFSDVRTSNALSQLLQDVITRRYAPTYFRQDPAYITACRALVFFYVKPHVFAMAAIQPQTQAQSLQEVPHNAAETKDLMAIFDPLWSAREITLLNKLNYMREDQENNSEPAFTYTYEQCAETYPIVSIQPNFFPATNAQLHHIRGLAMEPRAIGSTDLFDEADFSSKTLKLVPRYVAPRKNDDRTGGTGDVTNQENFPRACRYPCSNCRRLLPLLGVHAQLPQPVEYDKDLIAADVKPS